MNSSSTLIPPVADRETLTAISTVYKYRKQINSPILATVGWMTLSRCHKYVLSNAAQESVTFHHFVLIKISLGQA